MPGLRNSTILGTVETYDRKSYDKKSRPSIFDLWTPELHNLDLNIGFLVQNRIYMYIYSQLGIRQIQTLAPKNAMSCHMSQRKGISPKLYRDRFPLILGLDEGIKHFGPRRFGFYVNNYPYGQFPRSKIVYL